MSPNARHEATILIIFGFAGGLTWRRLVPALYHLFCENHLPAHFAILGVGHLHLSDKDFRGAAPAVRLVDFSIFLIFGG
jgi:glucose-6-phosphate 1-dehydrogenase